MPKRTLAGWLALLTVAVLGGAGCHPGDVDDIGELDVVVTFYDESVDFGAFATYAMEDTIYNLAVLADPEEEDTLDRRFDADILAQVEADPVRGPVWREILLETCNEPSIARRN